MTRVALGIEYDGAAYFGWQRQRNVNSVQAELEKALSSVADETVEIQCAGRTDAGVHATNQVVHFDSVNTRPMRAWTFGVNANLPQTIAVKWATNVSDDFHARFSATSRRYRYIIYNSQLRGGILYHGVTHFYHPLDAEKMHEAAQSLLGEQDFSAFRAALCQSKTPFRNVHHVKVTRKGDFVIVDIQANAFLHHMVRNIVGSLCEVGTGAQPIEWIAQLLAEKDRTKAAATAKANGLYLVAVAYPEEFTLPTPELGPLFLSM
ncbi:tRNA pseudouridine(38-40) synthase TruA [Alteromonas sp. a30]|uniref:tRNA pseudouridine(38-40) synthase TruA n=1 Tax=Alteromonas sp. a30 TaxID=2730917 RepID=UPI002280CA7F|nr:tRNA pseudouridine(38-40) synthase TruA [Alteromonas sp. a30]MCY7295249.1 tRNA pseudouridine(38-40) synthase TruA [Alteromonas sp. a30]